MRHNIITVAAVAASAILLTLSCTKQEEMQSVNKGKTFTATIEQAQTKTTLENNGDGKYFVNWNSGDLININAQAVYSAEPNSRKAGYAEFTFVKGQEPEPPYRAVYPADLYNSEDKSLYFPMVQQYEAGRCNAPMMAMGDEESLLFHNICGVICFSLTGTDRVRGIELFSESRRLWGRFSVAPDTWTAKVDEDESQIIGGMGMGMVNPNYVALDCGEDGVQLYPDEPTDFYMYLPANSYPENDLRVNITGTEGGEFSMTAEKAVTVERNCVYPFEWNVVFENGSSVDPVTPPDPVVVVQCIDISQTTILPGEFTVDDYGKKVKFTSGNVVWSGESGWECERNPGRIINPFENEADSVNLFLWHDNSSQARLGKATSAPETHYLFCDGHKAVFGIENSGTILSVPSMDWWKYILFEREDTRFVRARLNGMPGLILFPDNYTWTTQIEALFKKITDEGGTAFNNVEADFPENSLSLEEFSVLEKAGYVFLPAEGCRYYDSSQNKVIVDRNLTDDPGGHYWGVYDGGFALLNFTDEKIEVIGGQAYDDDWASVYDEGASIRLVQVIPAVEEAQEAEGQVDAPADGE